MVYEEKETDVNIAIAMLEGAVRDDYDAAILISGDSDLRPAVKSVKRIRPEKRVIAAFPPRRHSTSLAQAVDGYVSISTSKVRNAQLPPKIVTAGGVILERPEYWR
ncbi:MAG: NYN domain-containing protein [Trebonia sp.]